MVTYAQLQAETWWSREIITPELDQLGKWCRQDFRVSAAAVGTKGNNVHLNGSHRSQEWIKNSRYCTNRTYTVQPGLTIDQARCIAGFDLTPNSVADMLLLSQRLDRATRGGQLEEVVAWYGNLNGDTRVDGYDNIRNVAATSDPSHLWHLHLGLDRRVLRDITVMGRIRAVLTGTEVDDDMSEFSDWVRDYGNALVWRIDGLTKGLTHVAGGPTKGEEIVPNVKIALVESFLRTGVPVAAEVNLSADALEDVVATVKTALTSTEGQAAITRAANTAEDS